MDNFWRLREQGFFGGKRLVHPYRHHVLPHRRIVEFSVLCSHNNLILFLWSVSFVKESQMLHIPLLRQTVTGKTWPRGSVRGRSDFCRLRCPIKLWEWVARFSWLVNEGKNNLSLSIKSRRVLLLVSWQLKLLLEWTPFWQWWHQKFVFCFWGQHRGREWPLLRGSALLKNGKLEAEKADIGERCRDDVLD